MFGDIYESSVISYIIKQSGNHVFFSSKFCTSTLTSFVDLARTIFGHRFDGFQAENVVNDTSVF